ncbi:MAG: hypothetical protein UR25_C0002G0090 [Candidatus Nomurabacteria bacterium GW2011_GWE1_32_28]|uniref:Uncharacterized protein n=1 Tax=Candidatus Nomurabacteria bacterium GW2011_GWF1_31_48 TaxID=1618767 RepID=A0A0F9YFS0_9BACT|nr:MAG: hypothetical protein UR10_C0002G0090 [Candidatus Nomurabacteria bacterium GW2011_GWF2_30_133]KKP29021.1 MAG: hypothetical protein UR18_C0001G0142 [Candidatus Nomurabacteria bacterium GW2011_GWE2_31_40]KKP30569.1 MAG: hypothetical protein UR19_C0002G0090 [Candidatus Nomurabacteria bacterium GW2011_GWF1_31_48]KKP35054.1 MAG: hypothetical protein UR25_C0002G0090 [Candidatus Nomurabacteria bacterium GW2011_GWE1_32_28]
MEKDIKKNKKFFTYNNKEGGFLKLIIFLVIALFLMKYFKINASDIINWIKDLFISILN